MKAAVAEPPPSFVRGFVPHGGPAIPPGAACPIATGRARFLSPLGPDRSWGGGWVGVGMERLLFSPPAAPHPPRGMWGGGGANPGRAPAPPRGGERGPVSPMQPPARPRACVPAAGRCHLPRPPPCSELPPSFSLPPLKICRLSGPPYPRELSPSPSSSQGAATFPIPSTQASTTILILTPQKDLPLSPSSCLRDLPPSVSYTPTRSHRLPPSLPLGICHHPHPLPPAGSCHHLCPFPCRELPLSSSPSLRDLPPSPSPSFRDLAFSMSSPSQGAAAFPIHLPAGICHRPLPPPPPQGAATIHPSHCREVPPLCPFPPPQGAATFLCVTPTQSCGHPPCRELPPSSMRELPLFPLSNRELPLSPFLQGPATILPPSRCPQVLLSSFLRELPPSLTFPPSVTCHLPHPPPLGTCHHPSPPPYRDLPPSLSPPLRDLPPSPSPLFRDLPPSPSSP